MVVVMRLRRARRPSNATGNRVRVPTQRTAPDEEQPSSRVDRRTLRFSALVTVAVTLLVTAILTPFGAAIQNTIDQALGTGRDHDSGASASPSPSGTGLRRVSDRSGGLSLRVPATWGYGTAKSEVAYGIVDADHPGRTDYPGTVLVAGTAAALADDANDWSLPRVVVGASAAAARELNLVGANRQQLREWAKHYVESEDWTRNGCSLVGEEEPTVAEYVAVVRRWEGCAGLPATRFWELAAARDDGRALVTVQLKQAQLSTSTARTVLTSFSVAPERLPGTRVTGGDALEP